MASLDAQQIAADLEALVLPIKGLDILVGIPVSVETLTDMQEERDAYYRRRGLLNEAAAILARLEADGYPDLPPAVVSAAVFKELQDDELAIDAAMALFQEGASKLTINLGEPVLKPISGPS